MKPLDGKTAYVSGAGRGIGRAIAIGMAKAGANVAVSDIGPAEAIESVVDECRLQGVKVLGIPADAGVQSEVERAVTETVDEFGSLDIVVSNAAYSDRELFYKADMEGFEKTIQVTMWGAFYLVRAAANQMIAQGRGGTMVMVSSTHAHRPVPGAMAYNMSKAAVEMMTRTAATELCEHRIRLNMIQPGWIDTPGERKFFSEEQIKELGDALPWGRLGTPEEVARAAVFLSDPASEYLNDVTIKVTGGLELPVKEMHRVRDR